MGGNIVHFGKILIDNLHLDAVGQNSVAAAAAVTHVTFQLPEPLCQVASRRLRFNEDIRSPAVMLIDHYVNLSLIHI